jgi:hypothetical protein
VIDSLGFSVCWVFRWALAIGLCCSSTTRAVTNIHVEQSITETMGMPSNWAERLDEIHCNARTIISFGELTVIA